ncbi:3'-5' exonuclease [Phytomonospora sp. NPDC050363]|uniref:3'-5' exonuclease n=1 Tax=Phytomonospora sp. NPDC050363 TaxID=3155642 RepID=UPI0033C5B202
MSDWSRGIPGWRPTDWARHVLADPNAVVLDTETTGLGGYLVEIAVVTTGGRMLLDELVDPGFAIPAGATRVHGIRDADVAGAMRWVDLYPKLVRALRGRHVIIYNSAFDLGVLAREIARADVAHPSPPSSAWRGVLNVLGWVFGIRVRRPEPFAWLIDLRDRTSCAMHAHAAWAGEWDDCRDHYRWHPLDGGHRAAADVHAVLERLRQMAALP